MGFFDLKVVCGVCERKVGLNRYKLTKSNVWICPDCLKEAGGLLAVNVYKTTVEEIQDKLNKKQTKFSYNPMSTAEGMYNYCIDNGFGSGFNKKWGIKHFLVLENNLIKDEQVLMTFIGLYGNKATQSDGNYAYAITNRRILIGQKKITGHNFKAIYHEKINDITLQTGFAFGILTIDTPQEIINLTLDKDSAAAINTKVHQVLNQIKQYENGQPPKTVDSGNSSADELKKFKELLDMQAITQEEYDAKKKQLLKLL